MGILNRFPSVDQLFKGAGLAFTRFPLTLICAALLAYLLVDIIGAERSSIEFTKHRLSLAASLGLLLFTAIYLWSEKRQFAKYLRLLYQAISIVLLAAYYFSLPENPFGIESHPARFTLITIGLLSLISFLPFLGRGQINQFWKYNIVLLHRFLLAGLYSAIMYIGLMVALLAADYLFGFEVKDVRYFQLWIVMAVLFNTWGFLAGVPKNLSELSGGTDYPKILKVFTQYLLLPLVGLYFVILFSYEFKIIFSWNWPKGWVSQMVLWYSIVGIFSILLLHPLRENKDNRWIQVFMKWFFITLIPLVTMLFLAIMRRISDYGITVNRYFVFMMAVGLSLVVLYFLFSKIKDIRLIPVIICCGAFFSSFGPWGAISVSEANQKGRLEKLLVANAILADGKLQKAPADVTFEDRKDISSIVLYLTGWHGLDTFSGWLSDSTLQAIDSVNKFAQPSRITKIIGFDYVGWAQSEETKKFKFFRLKEDIYIDISNFDQLMEFSFSGRDSVMKMYTMDSDTIHIWVDNRRQVLEIHYKSETNANVLEFPIMESLDRIDSLSYRRDNVPIEELTFSASRENVEFKLILSKVTLLKNEKNIDVDRVSGYLLIRRH